MIREAHDRKVRVEIVFSSFGSARNKQLFGGTVARQDKVIASLVAFAHDLGVDGINVDVESIDPEFVPSYGAFVGRLRDGAPRRHRPRAQVSVATTAHIDGRRDGGRGRGGGRRPDLPDGLRLPLGRLGTRGLGAARPARRRAAGPRLVARPVRQWPGVPVQRTLLGLPFYGMSWPVTGPELGRPGHRPRRHLDPGRTISSGTTTRRSPRPSIPSSRSTSTRSPTPTVEGGWQGIYVDSPATLTPKLALADARGLAGAGFWAIGYERGLPGYTDLVKRFADGKLD